MATYLAEFDFTRNNRVQLGINDEMHTERAIKHDLLPDIKPIQKAAMQYKLRFPRTLRYASVMRHTEEGRS